MMDAGTKERELGVLLVSSDWEFTGSMVQQSSLESYCKSTRLF